MVTGVVCRRSLEEEEVRDCLEEVCKSHQVMKIFSASDTNTFDSLTLRRD